VPLENLKNPAAEVYLAVTCQEWYKCKALTKNIDGQKCPHTLKMK